MKDRTGLEFHEAVAVQREHLAQWKPRLEPKLFKDASAYAIAQNQEAGLPEQYHRVYRGQDLIEIFRTWPNLCAAYPPTHAFTASEFI